MQQALGGGRHSIEKRVEKREQARKEEGDYDIPLAQRREIIRLHRNTGHESVETMCRVMKHAGVKAEVTEWTNRHFLCPACAARVKPGSVRLSISTKNFALNYTIGLDCVEHHFEGQKICWLSQVCWGTGRQCQVMLEGPPSADSVFRAFSEDWVKHYGWPEVLVVDQG